MNFRRFSTGFAPAAVVFLASLPLLALAQAQPLTEPPVLQVCRAAVFPCQQELHLTVGDETALDLRLVAAKSGSAGAR